MSRVETETLVPKSPVTHVGGLRYYGYLTGVPIRRSYSWGSIFGVPYFRTLPSESSTSQDGYLNAVSAAFNLRALASIKPRVQHPRLSAPLRMGKI